VEKGTVHAGVVHLGHQALGRVGHIDDGGRQVLLEVALSFGGPFEPPVAGGPEIGVLEGVEAGPV
jgi:hypothetical protein